MQTGITDSSRAVEPMVTRHSTLFRILLICGVLSSLLWVAADMAASLSYPGYSYVDSSVSELSAIGAPTRSWLPLVGMVTVLLELAFAVGVWLTSSGKRGLRLAVAFSPRLIMTIALESLAGVVVVQGYAELAARLLAAASALRMRMGTPVRPTDRALLEQALEAARSILGEEGFAAIWAVGKNFCPDQRYLHVFHQPLAPVARLRSMIAERLAAMGCGMCRL